MDEKLRNALEHPKSTLHGVVALVAAIAISIFVGVNEGFNSESLGYLGGVCLLVLGAIQRIFFAKDKPK